MIDNLSPCFSIIIPAYNVEKYIDRAISSVLNQSFQNFEMIVIDDCSTDDTLRIITSHAEKNKNIIVIKHLINQSQHIARINGVNVAKGKFILFLDGDDSFTEEAFSILFDVVQNNPDYDFYEFGYIEQPSRKIVFPFFTGKDRFSAYFTRDNYPLNTIWNKIYKSQLLKSAFSFMENISIRQGVEDIYESIVIAYFSKETMITKNVIVNYSVGTGVSTTYKDYKKTMEFLVSIKSTFVYIQKFLEKIKQNISLDNINYRYLAFTVYWYINSQKNIEEKKKLFLQLPDFFDIKIIMEYLFNREEEYKNMTIIANSKEYWLGKIILYPLRKIKRIIKNNYLYGKT